MQVHKEWTSEGFALPPVALATSVFPRRGYLEQWWQHFGVGELRLVEDDSALLALWHDANGAVSFVGDEELTDYHSPLGTGAGSLLGEYLAQLPPGTPFSFDSLPLEAAEELAMACGSEARSAQHEAAYRIDLPDHFEGFLASRSKKERHELRRKHRRFSETVGEPRLVEGTADPVAVFIELHRMSGGRKGEFMTPGRESFFRSLADLPGCRIDVVSGESDAPVAAAIGFQDSEGYYLYNSAYDPANQAISPGIVMLMLLFEQAIEAGVAIFDFLKGDESYKSRLGAQPRPLYALVGQT